MLIAAVIPLAGCGTMTEAEKGILEASRTFAVTQIIAFNAAGVDPLNLNEQQRVYASLGCGLISGGVELLSPDPAVVNEIVDWCDAFMMMAD